MGQIAWSDEVAIVVAGNTGAAAKVEGEVVCSKEGLLRAYRIRASTSGATANYTIQQKTGELHGATDYNLVASTTPSLDGNDNQLVILDPPIPFQNLDSSPVAKLYFVFDDNGGVGEAGTMTVSIGYEVG